LNAAQHVIRLIVAVVLTCTVADAAMAAAH
jgi:hypothetical protein